MLIPELNFGKRSEPDEPTAILATKVEQLQRGNTVVVLLKDELGGRGVNRQKPVCGQNGCSNLIRQPWRSYSRHLKV